MNEKLPKTTEICFSLKHGIVTTRFKIASLDLVQSSVELLYLSLNICDYTHEHRIMVLQDPDHTYDTNQLTTEQGVAPYVRCVKQSISAFPTGGGWWCVNTCVCSVLDGIWRLSVHFPALQAVGPATSDGSLPGSTAG